MAGRSGDQKAVEERLPCRTPVQRRLPCHSRCTEARAIQSHCLSHRLRRAAMGIQNAWVHDDPATPPIACAPTVMWRRGVAACALFACLAACSSAPVRNPLAQWHGSPNHDARRAQLIVLHHTGKQSAQAALVTLQTGNSQGRVSAHYLIGRDGTLYQLVSEYDRAWHAGAGSWGGIADVNSASIGIELDNDGTLPYTEPLIQTLLLLLQDVTQRLEIPRHLVIAHGDVAPTRKRDPGELFPWQRLADAGFGLWPRPARLPAPVDFNPWAALRLIGYDLADPVAALRAFHRHYRGIESEHLLPDDTEILFDLLRQLTLEVAPATGAGAPADAPANAARLPASAPRRPSEHP